MKTTVITDNQVPATARITPDSLMVLSVFVRHFLILADFVHKSLEGADGHEGLTDEQRQGVSDMRQRLEILSEVAKEVICILELAARLASESIGKEVVISLFAQDEPSNGAAGAAMSKYIH